MIPNSQLPADRAAEVTQALSRVMEPDLQRGLVAARLVRDVRVDGDNVSLTVVLTSPASPHREAIEREVREAICRIGLAEHGGDHLDGGSLVQHGLRS